METEEWVLRYPNFRRDRLRCQETGEEGINLEFLDAVQLVRTQYGKPMWVTSGYRSPRHSIEKRKSQPGEHAQGLAIDVWVPTEDFLELSTLWFNLGYRRVGWNPGKFLHLGGSKTLPQTVWTY